MNINRHNYEEYFILYMDNELTGDERRMVVDFIQANPDLKDELDLLLQSRLTPDNNIVFENKSDLIKTTETADINISNYEEWLILYIDNELTIEQKIAVEKFAEQHPSVKTDLELFSKTKFDPKEEIIFSDKESLYRRAEKVRAIDIRWWRAAAAVLILAFGITGLVVLNKKSVNHSDKSIASTKNNSSTTTTERAGKKDIQKKTISVQPEIASNADHQKTGEVKQSLNKIIGQKNEPDNIAFSKKPVNTSPVQLIKDKSTITESALTNNLPDGRNNPNVKMQSATEPVLASTNFSEKNITNSQTNKTPVTEQVSQSSSQKPAPEFANLDEGDNKKTRGFFRKAIRLFSKTTKINPADDDGRLMIGAVTVNLR